MPVRGNTFVNGDLFIKFDVKFPAKGSLSPDVLQESRPRRIFKLFSNSPPHRDQGPFLTSHSPSRKSASSVST